MQIGQIDVNSLGCFEQQWHKRTVHRQEYRKRTDGKKLRPLDTHDENNFAQKNVLICKDWNSNLKFAHQIAAHRNPTNTYSDCVSLVHGHFSNPTETFFFATNMKTNQRILV